MVAKKIMKVLKSAVTGKFVSKKYADKNPDTTFKQTVSKGKPKKKK